MGGFSVIDRFLAAFTAAIDSGFGLLSPEVAWLSAALVALDMTLAGLFWAMEGDDVIARLVKKTLYVGFFAFLIGNFNGLARIVFESFAGLGLTAGGGTVAMADFLRPSQLARVGIDAGRPILAAIGDLMGFVSFFENFVQIFILLLAWLVLLLAFFVLAVQLFITLIEFKLTTLAGFVLVPFGLWGKSAFLAERVLGNVVTSGIKVLVLAVIVAIATPLFSQFTAAVPAGTQPSLDDALAIMLASLAMLGLGIFGPGIAAGLVSGAPQLGAGAAAATALAAAGAGMAAGAATIASGRAGIAGIRAAAALAGSARTAYQLGAITSGATGMAAVGAGMAGMARTAGGAVAGMAGDSLKARFAAGQRAAWQASGGAPMGDAAPTRIGSAPGWARDLRRTGMRGAELGAHTLRHGDGGGQGANPSLDPEA
ncbi:MAG: P-type conjugative transfer protein TrbL [Bacteroidota bacterium]